MVSKHTTVLLISSQRAPLDELAISFSRKGIQVFHCQELEAAEALLSHHEIRAIVTTMRLSPYHGLEGLKLIHRVTTQFPHALAIALIDQVDEEIRSLIVDAGGDAIFFMPTDKVSNDKVVKFTLSTIGHESSAKGQVEEMGLLDDLLNEGDLGALLQPIVRLEPDGFGVSTLGLESLAHIPHRFRLLSPEVLFAYAANKERLFETDTLCIDAALKEACLIVPFGKLFINVRPQSLIHPAFCDALSDMISSASILPSNIVLELTEQQNVANLPTFAIALRKLKAKGFQIALDDFGSGFANLRLIQILEPDYIKVSGIFCNNIDKDEAKQIIVHATAEMARRLNIPAILENVETREELVTARKLGISYSQGFLFKKPCSAKALADSNWFENYPPLS